MQTMQGRIIQSLRDVAAFLDRNATTLVAAAQSGARQKLAAAIAQVSTFVADQAGSGLASKGATLKHRALRRALIRDHMKPIARVARAELPDTPELSPLKLPQTALSTERLSAAAYGMAQAAAPHSDLFTAAGLPADFMTQLTAAADAMIAPVSDRAQIRSNLRGATTGLQTKLSAARRVVGVLDSFVQSALKDDPAQIAAWNSAKRVQLFGGGKPTSTSNSASTPTPTPAPTPALPAPTQGLLQ
jgi:hypothetical protein